MLKFKLASGLPLLLTLLALLALLTVQAGDSTSVQAADSQDQIHFEKVIRPLLVKHCYECHSQNARRLEASLHLHSRESLLRGGDSGAAIVPGDPARSLLIDAIQYGTYEMPPKGKLPAAEIQALTDWVKNGAPWPDEPRPQASGSLETFDLYERKQSHWSWQPLQRPALPDVQQKGWPSSDLDRFILARLEQGALQPALPADDLVWLRRVYLDLIGLPPSPAQIRTFQGNKSPDAREQVVDGLLQSPQFGEKWARHWMDLVRYAETYGHEFDYPIPHAFRYRDYLVRALNADVPYDQMVREHIAGDLLEQPRINPEQQFNESIIGTGFWFLGEAVHAPTHVLGDLSTRIENQIDVFSRAFLGLSVACARCHDHKFDAISKEDYYALYGILNSSHRDEAWLDPQGRIAAAANQFQKLQLSANEKLPAILKDAAHRDCESFAPYLTAAGEVISLMPQLLSASSQPKDAAAVHEAGVARQKLIDRIAASRQLDAAVLQRWVAGLTDDDLTAPEHPLFALQKLATVSDSVMPQVREQLLRDQRTRAAAAREPQNGAQKFVSFGTKDWASWKDWQVTGEAFGSRPVAFDGRLRGNWNQEMVQLQVPGVATTEQGPARLRGSLRSPLFIIEKPFVHYRVRGRGGMIRLVVENYFMDHYSPLLFGGLTRKGVETKGKWVWITQGGDVANYLGRRAHLEFLDYGEGGLEVAEVWFSDSATPPVTSGSQSTSEWLDGESLSKQSQLAVAGANYLIGALQWAASQQMSTGDVEAVNWLLKHDLINVRRELAELGKPIREAAAKVPDPVSVLAIVDGPGLNEPLHIRGSDENFGPEIPRRFLTAIAGDDQPRIEHGSGRRELAELMTSVKNPFLSRVYVNRLWHHLFGRGLVASVDDFGVMGQAPSHPELLDWLALELKTKDYSTKEILKTIVLSSTYAMSSQSQSAAAEEQDPDNLLLHRMSVRRLSAEAIRDSMLRASGQLDFTMYGSSVPVHLNEFMTGRGRPAKTGPLDGDGRRSLYQEIRRNFLSPMMLTFDMPSPFSCMGRRAVSNVPSQSLMLMNDPFVVQQAQDWAKRVLSEESDRDRRITRLYEDAFGRPATATELQDVAGFLKEQAVLYGCEESDSRVWGDLCHLLFNAKEFLFVQ